MNLRWTGGHGSRKERDGNDINVEFMYKKLTLNFIGKIKRFDLI